MNEAATRIPLPPATLPREKKPYVAPNLVCYGKVAALTQSGSCNAQGDSGKDVCTGPGSMSGTWASDRSIKCDVMQVGMHPKGFGLYLFRYKPAYQGEWGSGRRFGVMADEVEQIFPEAVQVHRDGYKVVSYPLLGIDFQP